MKFFHVYILSSIQRTLYVGVSGDLERRLAEHRAHVYPDSFTAKYRVDRLVHVEEFTSSLDAIAREKQIKGWRRSKKVALIESQNPSWADLSCPAPPGPSLRSG